MATVTQRVAVPPDQVFAVLADGWSYAGWVVGASRIRQVDTTWPEVGSRIHHSVGVWPLVLNDSTEVVAVERDRELVLKARGWPAGEARVHFTLAPDGPDATRVTVEEDASSGPGVKVPAALRQAVIVPRNRETLRRLALIAEGHSGRQGS